MSVHSFKPKEFISLSTFKFACDPSKIHESAAMWILGYYVPESLANALIVARVRKID